jgi:hypothetical protein
VPALTDEVPGVTEYSCVIEGLDPDQSYEVFVSAINDKGDAEIAVLNANSEPLVFEVLEAEEETAPIVTDAPVPVPVNSPWFLLLLALTMLGWSVRRSRLAGRA